MYAPSDGISPPRHAPGQLREPERPVAVRHHCLGTAPGGLGWRDLSALRAGVPRLRGGAHIAARAVVALPPIFCAARRDGRQGVAVSEGIRVMDGRYVFELSDHVEFVDAFGHKQLAGSAKFLANKIGSELGIKTRAIELSTLQRCASHMSSRTDITEAYNVGGAAVKAAFEGESGKVVVLKRVSDDPYMCITETHDVHQIANIEKKVPLEWITEDDFVTDDLIHYIRPLIQAELSPIMVDGLPRHLNVDM